MNVASIRKSLINKRRKIVNVWTVPGDGIAVSHIPIDVDVQFELFPFEDNTVDKTVNKPAISSPGQFPTRS